MKGKKSVLKMLFIMLVICSIGIITSNVQATSLASNELIKVNNKTITKTTSISQVNEMFGTPKMETDNAFGGKTYSYHDDAYTWYLTIEMDASGNIKGYGAIGGDFVAKRYAYGDSDDCYIWTLSGTIIKEWEDDAVYGIYEYNCSSSDITSYWNRYKTDSSKYLYELQKHGAIASKVLATREGYEFPQTYPSEDVFYRSEQLKYNGSNYYDYAVNNGKTKLITQVTSRTDSFYNDLPNPIRLGKMTEGYEYASAYKYVLYDIEITNYSSASGYTRMFYINPDFLAEKSEVELTQEEKVKLQNVKEQYELYKEHGEAITDMYVEEPNYESLPLVAGKYSTTVLQHVTDYLNIARVGIGMDALTLNEDIADAAQHKAVLVRYMSSVGLETGHFPEQPDGVDDEFYKKAQSYMCENLYMGTIISSIDYAMNDAYGDPVGCGHRYNLLEPTYTEWGPACAGNQGAHKFWGSSGNLVELVAWPSNGIFPLDMVSRGIGNWTAQFYKNYTVSDETEVTIKCLNTGKTYEITNENKNESGKLLKVTQGYLLTFRDDNISYEDGDVFEITLHNVKNSNDENVDYTYRSVFTSLSQLENVEVTEITVNENDISLTLGQTKRIYATVTPTDASNKLMNFSSSDESIVSVRQDGTITALKAGEATITVTCEGAQETITVLVEKAKKGDINQDGIIDSADAAIALNLYKYNSATSAQIELGDMDENGMIDSADAAMILNIFKYN